MDHPPAVNDNARPEADNPTVAAALRYGCNLVRRVDGSYTVWNHGASQSTHVPDFSAAVTLLARLVRLHRAMTRDAFGPDTVVVTL